MKREVPTDREIAELFGPAYEKWAEPDARRLMAIEERLLDRRQRHVSTAWWWLFAVLATGAASALSENARAPHAPEVPSWECCPDSCPERILRGIACLRSRRSPARPSSGSSSR